MLKVIEIYHYVLNIIKIWEDFIEEYNKFIITK